MCKTAEIVLSDREPYSAIRLNRFTFVFDANLIDKLVYSKKQIIYGAQAQINRMVNKQHTDSSPTDHTSSVLCGLLWSVCSTYAKKVA